MSTPSCKNPQSGCNKITISKEEEMTCVYIYSLYNNWHHASTEESLPKLSWSL